MANAPGPSIQLRDSVKRLSPPWLKDGDAEKFLYTIGLCGDLLLEKLNQGVRMRMPGQGDPSALPYLGDQYLLEKGPAETDASFAARITGANQAWQGAGNRVSVLNEVQAYLTNLQPGVAAGTRQCLIVGGNAAWTTWSTLYNGATPGAGPSLTRIAAGSPAGVWNWDGQVAPWRAWLVLFMQPVATGNSGTGATVASIGGSGVAGVTSGFATINGLSGITSADVQRYLLCAGGAHPANNALLQIVAVPTASSCIVANPSAVATDTVSWSTWSYPFIAPGPVWGAPGALWGDTNRSWGLSCSADVITSIRQIVQTWKSQRTYYPDIIVSFSGASGVAGDEFSPNSAQGSGNPDGTWGGLGKTVGGIVVPAKQPLNPFTAFCDGTGQAINCYAKNRT